MSSNPLTRYRPAVKKRNRPDESKTNLGRLYPITSIYCSSGLYLSADPEMSSTSGQNDVRMSTSALLSWDETEIAQILTQLEVITTAFQFVNRPIVRFAL